MIERMFKWVLCARQPLHVDEVCEGIAFTLDDEHWDADKIPTNFNRLVRACSNLVVVDKDTQIVQLAHFTVQQYLLQPEETRFHFTMQDANITAGEFCIAYLSFSDFEAQLTKHKDNTATDMIALAKIASATHGAVLAQDHPAHRIFHVLNKLRASDTKSIEIDMLRHIPKQAPKKSELSKFSFLPYVASNWLWHTSAFSIAGYPDRRHQLFRHLALWKKLPFDFRPWDDFNSASIQTCCIALLGWALTANHAYLAHMVAIDEQLHCDLIFGRAWEQLYPVLEVDTSVLLIPETSLDRLDLLLEDSDIPQSPSHDWLYSRLLYACRDGFLDVLSACRLEDRSTCSYIVEYIILEAARFGQVSVVEYFSGVIDTYKKVHTVCTLSSPGRCSNAVEHASLAGHTHIVQLLVDRGYRLPDGTSPYSAGKRNRQRRKAIESLEDLADAREFKARRLVKSGGYIIHPELVPTKSNLEPL